MFPNYPESNLAVDRALRQLEEEFVTLRLPPGSMWSEALLSELLQMGRTPVREAVARMANDGLLTVMPRAGIVVSEISLEQQLAVLDTRRVLEKLVSVRAAQRATPVECEKLRALADGIEQAGAREDVHAYIRNHFDLKRFVAQCARNPCAARALRPLHTLSQRFYFAHYREFDNLPQVGAVHAQLSRAIADGDAAQAAVRSDKASDVAEEFTAALLDRQRRVAVA